MILQPRQINGFTIFNETTPTSCKITATKDGQAYSADFFGGANKFQIVGTSMLLIAARQQGHYIFRARDLVGAIFDTSRKIWVPASFPLRTPAAQTFCLWIKVGSGADINPPIPNDPGGNIIFPSIAFPAPGLVYWETERVVSLEFIDVLSSPTVKVEHMKGAGSEEMFLITERWQRQIKLADATMGPIQSV